MLFRSETFTRDPINGPLLYPVNSTVYAISVQPDNRILVAGDFSAVNAQRQPRVARLLPNGFIDETFDTGAGPNNSVRSLTLLPNGQVIIGGYFTQYAGVTRNRIARLNSNGALDLAFDPGAGPNAVIETMKLMENGKLVVGGDFTQFNSYVRQRLARLNAVPVAESPGVIQVSTTVHYAMEGQGHIVVSARRIDGSQFPVTVNFATQTGTAAAGDFGPVSGVFSWADGESGEKQISIPIVSDGLAEGLESFTFKLSNPTGGAVLDTANAATIYILDNDPSLLDASFDPGAEVLEIGRAHV